MAFYIGRLSAKEFDFVRFDLQSRISERIVNEGQDIGDIVVAEREFGHAIVELPAIDNQLSLSAIDNGFYCSIFISIQKIRAGQRWKDIGQPLAGRLMTGSADGDKEPLAEFDFLGFGLWGAVGRCNASVRALRDPVSDR